MMEVVVTAGAIKHAKLQSDRRHQQTNVKRFTGRMPSCPPTNSWSTEGKRFIKLSVKLSSHNNTV